MKEERPDSPQIEQRRGRPAKGDGQLYHKGETMTLRQKIESILDDRNIGFGAVEDELRAEILDEIMNEISKDVYGKPLHGME